MSRDNRPITPEDCDTLIRLHGQGLLNIEIARAMDRRPCIVTRIMQVFGLKRNTMKARTAQLSAQRKAAAEKLKNRNDAEFLPRLQRDPLLDRLQAGRR